MYIKAIGRCRKLPLRLPIIHQTVTFKLAIVFRLSTLHILVVIINWTNSNILKHQLATKCHCSNHKNQAEKEDWTKSYSHVALHSSGQSEGRLYVFFSFLGRVCFAWTAGGIGEPGASGAIVTPPSAVFRVPNRTHAWRCSETL
jgi:hypothetical protein